VKALSNEFAISVLCEVLQVSRSGYYAWLKEPQSPRQSANAQLLVKVQDLFQKHRGNYGSPRITAALRQQGLTCNRKRIERLMRRKGLRARIRKRFRVVTTDSHHDGPIALNLLPERTVTAPDQVWCVDITYVPTSEGWLYLAGVLDLYSRRIVGWAMADHLETSLPLAALNMALVQRRPGTGLLHHSDRGVQYASGDYRRRLLAHGIEPSMSRKGNCYDNAAMESFWSTLKNELLHRLEPVSRPKTQRMIFEWIETYYNRVRLHSSLGHKSPVDFENQLN
jgi:transposase InsO family protein